MSAIAATDARDAAAYEREKSRAAHADDAVRRDLAREREARPEILYYLASDRAAAVRREIAANPQTPYQADLLLLKDANEDVRGDLALKVARLLPNLGPEAQSQVRERVVEMVRVLARDQVARIRAIVAEALKEVADAPPDVIRSLARDVELMVCEPVLRFSPLLTDDDLLAIIAVPPVKGARRAVAQRDGLSAVLSDAIADVGDEAAIAALLANPSAQIREETLDLLVDRAPAHPSWHPPLVDRPALPVGIVTRIAAFVAATLLRRLEQRQDLDPAARKAVATAVARRLAEPEMAAEAKTAASKETAEERALRLKKDGKLDEAAVTAALDSGDRAFAIAALGVLSELGGAMAGKILSARGPKGIVALAWKAGLNPRLAAQIQLRLAGIPPKQLLQPRAGNAWPMNPDEMTWHLDFFRS
jgi:uncharacterized protein (DUF2336 family)